MPSAGRTSMPTSAPEMPVTLTDPVAFFCAVSTVAMVSPPIRAATCAALAAADDSNSAAEAAKIERKFIVKLPVFHDPPGTNTAGTGGAAKRMREVIERTDGHRPPGEPREQRPAGPALAAIDDHAAGAA